MPNILIPDVSTVHRTVDFVAYSDSQDDLENVEIEAIDVEDALNDDPFYDPGLDARGDAELQEYFAKAYKPSGNREQVSALSALSAQMDAYKPLSVADQEACFVVYNKGLHAIAILNSSKKLSSRKTEQLQRDVAAGEQAQTQLVGSMFRLVLVIARELSGKRYGREKSLDLLSDLVADANLELVKAVSDFDPTRGPAFNVYAGRVVRERIRNSLSKPVMAGIPSSWLRVKRLATTLGPELTDKLGRRPSTAEMQEALLEQCMEWAWNKLSDAQRQLPQEERLGLMKAKLVKQGMIGAIKQYEDVIDATQQLWNLDAPVGGDGQTRLMDMIGETPTGDTFDAVELSQLRDSLLRALESLSERDREIVLYRFGFIDGEMWTYAKLAPRYEISAERVRQIERSALSKLRGPGFDSLGDFLPSRF